MQHETFAANAPSGVTCPRCRRYWQAAAVGVECGNCGGPLPPPPGPSRGHGPPPAPRHLPEKYTRDVLLWKNVGALVGTFFAAFGGLFGGIGLALRSATRRSSLRQIAALTHGYPAEGPGRRRVVGHQREHQRASPVSDRIRVPGERAAGGRVDQGLGHRQRPASTWRAPLGDVPARRPIGEFHRATHHLTGGPIWAAAQRSRGQTPRARMRAPADAA